MDNMEKTVRKQISGGTLVYNLKNGELKLEHNGKLIQGNSVISDFLSYHHIPVKARFEITHTCNFHCKSCKITSTPTCDELGTERIFRMFDILERSGIMFLEITGGEPFYRNDIQQILKHLETRNFIISITTNGSFISESVVKQLSRMNIGSVNIFLMAPDYVSYQSMTGVDDSFDKVVNSILRLMINNINVKVKVMLTRKNIQYLYDFSSLESRLGLRFDYVFEDEYLYSETTALHPVFFKSDFYESEKHCISDNPHEAFQEPVSFDNMLTIDSQGNIISCSNYRAMFCNIFNDSEDFFFKGKAKSSHMGFNI